MQVRLTVTGDKAVMRRFESMSRQAGSFKAPLVEIATIIAEGDDKTWGRGKPLAPKTVANKARLNEDTAKLVVTGGLKEDLATHKGVKLVSNDILVFGTDKFYAQFTQKGTKHQPRRKVLKFGPKAKLAAAEVLKAHLLKKD